MRQQRQRLRIVAVVVGLSLVAAACSGDDDDNAGQREPKEDPAIAALKKTGDADPDCENDNADGTFQIGGLLAQTGDLAQVLGAPQEAGAELAIADVNKAGGVNGKPVVYTQHDTGDGSPDLATEAVEDQLGAGVDAVLGPSGSQIAQDQIEKVTDECTIMFSSSNTGPLFTTYEDHDLYFRTAAPDILQGHALGSLAFQEGSQDAVILARKEAYGEGLDAYIKSGFEDAGGRVTDEVFYNPDATEFDAQVDKVVAADPAALFMVGLAETGPILTRLIEKGFTPATKKIYFVNGNMTAETADAFTQPGALRGIKGTSPGAAVSKPLRDRMLKQNPKLLSFIYGPETYDAVVVLALAAEVAKTDESAAVARKVNGVTRDGQKCTDYAGCKKLIEQGEDIDYDGQSGPLEFGLPGEPAAANYGVYGWTQDNRIDVEHVTYLPISM